MSPLFAEFTPIVQSLAWPVALVVITLLFRSEIGRSLERLDHLKFRDVEAQFRADLRLSEALAVPASGAGSVAEPKRLLDLPPEVRRVFPEINAPGQAEPTAVRRSPRERIEGAWEGVLGVAERAAGVAGVDPLPFLVERGAVSGASLLLFERLRRLAGGLDANGRWEPSGRDADRFARLAADLAGRLDAPPPRAIDRG